MKDLLQNPDDLGSAEYRAIYDLVTDSAETPDEALEILNEFRAWAQAMEKRICHLAGLPPNPGTPQAFVALVARMKTVEESDDPQDAVDTLNQLIGLARESA